MEQSALVLPDSSQNSEHYQKLFARVYKGSDAHYFLTMQEFYDIYSEFSSIVRPDNIREMYVMAVNFCSAFRTENSSIIKNAESSCDEIDSLDKEIKVQKICKEMSRLKARQDILAYFYMLLLESTHNYPDSYIAA